MIETMESEPMVSVEIDGSGSQSIKAALHKVIQSHMGPTSTEEIVAEVVSLMEFTSEEKIKRHDQKIAQDVRKVVGTLKAKGVHRIMDAFDSKQGEFALQLGESTLVTIDEDTVIPMDYAGISDFKLHRQHHHSKRMAQIDEIRNADTREHESIRHIESRMEAGKILMDYDNGDGVAIM